VETTKTARKVITTNEFVSEQTLIERAAFSYALGNIKQSKRGWETGYMGSFPLKPEFIKRLAEVGFTLEKGIGTREGMLYLSGHSQQGKTDVWESDCWAWKVATAGPEQYLTVHFHLFPDDEQRGIVVRPEIWGNCNSGAVHRPTIDKLASAISDHFPLAHQLIKQTKGAYPVIAWSELDYPGLRSFDHLFFAEFCEDNDMAMKLSRSTISPFSPGPTRGIINAQLFVPAYLHAGLKRQWRKQLDKFKEELG